MLSGWDCAWTTNLMRVPFWSGVAKWPWLAKGDDVVVEGLKVAVGVGCHSLQSLQRNRRH